MGTSWVVCQWVALLLWSGLKKLKPSFCFFQYCQYQSKNSFSQVGRTKFLFAPQFSASQRNFCESALRRGFHFNLSTSSGPLPILAKLLRLKCILGLTFVVNNINWKIWNFTTEEWRLCLPYWLRKPDGIEDSEELTKQAVASRQ